MPDSRGCLGTAMRFLLLSLAFASLAFVNPARADDSDGDGSQPPPSCGGCVPTGGGSSTWQTAHGGSVQISVTLGPGICRWVDAIGCLERDCGAAASVTWWGQPAGTTLTTPGNTPGTTVTTPTAGSGSANLAQIQVDCGGNLNYTATLSDGNSSTWALKCSDCKEVP